MSSSESSPLFSPQWYRVSSLRPSISASVSVNCQSNRGQRWYLLSLNGQSKRVRINETAYQVIGRCDGSQSLDTVFKTLLQTDPESTASQPEIVELVGKLIVDGYLNCDEWPDLGVTLDEQNTKRRKEVRSRLNPIAPRVSLINPSRLLTRLDWLGKALFSALGFAVWLLVVVIGLLCATADIALIGAFANQWMQSPSMWLISALCFPVIKLVHEITHGLAVRRWGGNVTDAGMALLLLMPTPYVDASDANQFGSAYQRAWVSAAGIVAELAIAAVTIFLWSLLEDGMLRSVLFSCALIATVSTIFFNANPLVKLDGYYVLTDIARLPNLSQRSQQLWHGLFCKYLMKIGVPALDTANGERGWLLLYQPLSWLYRLCIFFWFSWWIGTYSMSVALVIATCAVLWLVVWPIAKLAAVPLQTGKPLTEASQSWLRLGALCCAFVVLSFIPIPDRTLAQGIVWTPEESIVRARHGGFVAPQPNPDNQLVLTNQVLLTMTDPVVDAQIDAIQSRMPGLQSAWLANLSGDDATRARHEQEQLRQAKRELAFAKDAKNRLQVTSPSHGLFRLNDQWRDMVDRYVNEGDMLGFIDRNQAPIVRVVLSQNQAARVRFATHARQTVAASIRFADSALNTQSAQLLQATPGPAIALPSAALASANGGQIEVRSDEPNSLTLLQPGYLIDVVTTDTLPAALGSRAWVRLDFGYKSAAGQLARWVKQLMNSETVSHFG